jgi:hypothetical protein
VNLALVEIENVHLVGGIIPVLQGVQDMHGINDGADLLPWRQVLTRTVIDVTFGIEAHGRDARGQHLACQGVGQIGNRPDRRGKANRVASQTKGITEQDDRHPRQDT